MTTDGQQHPWIRQDGESSPAYEAFRTYMVIRSTTKVAEELAKSDTIIKRWCGQWNWVDRLVAYDRYTAQAETDGIVDAVVQARNENLELVKTLRDHLRNRLADYVRTKTDPSMRWISAAKVMADLEKHSFGLVNDAHAREQMEEVKELLARIAQVNDRV